MKVMLTSGMCVLSYWKKIKSMISKKEKRVTKVITVCGSYKFKKEMLEITEKLTLDGNCVLTPIELSKSDKEAYTEEEAMMIDKMHKEKIRLSDAIYVVNVSGYIGKSTK